MMDSKKNFFLHTYDILAIEKAIHYYEQMYVKERCK